MNTSAEFIQPLITVFDAVADGVIASDKAGKLIYANAPAAHILGVASSADVIMLTLAQVAHSVEIFDEAGQPTSLSKWLDEAQTVPVNLCFRVKRTGVDLWANVTARQVLNPAGEIELVVFTLHEIPRPSLLEHKNLLDQQALRDFVDNVPVGVHWLDANGRILWVNRAELDLLGYAPEEYIGHHIAEFYVDKPVAAEMIQRLTNGEVLHNYEVQVRCKDGSSKYMYIDTNGLWENGKFVHTRSISRDITERRQVVHGLRRERELLQAIYNHIPVMIALYESDTKVLRLNREFEHLTGWTTEDARQVDLMEKCYPDPEYREWVRDYMSGLTGGWLDIVMTTRDGNSLETTWSNIRVADDTHVGFGIDIRARKRAEEQLEQRLAQLQAIYDLNNAVSRADAMQQVYAIALEGLVDHLGADRASILLFDPDGVMRFKAWRGLSDGYRRQTEGHSPWSQDTQNPEPVLVFDVEQEPGLATLQAVIANEGIRALGFIPLVSEGKLLGKFMIYYNVPHQFSDSEVQFTQTLASHIAFAIEHKGIEQRRLELLQREHEARLQAEKADALKLQFLAMITHELRTPLTSIKGFTSTLLADDVVFDAPTQHTFLATIDEEADKLKELIEQLIDISRLQAGNLRIKIKEQSLENVIDVARVQLHTLTHNHLLKFDIPQGLQAVMADEQRIAQVLVNLVDNAAKYSPSDTRIVINASDGENFIQISVSDEGDGIPLEERESVFEAFRQINQKSTQRGAGLGLAICKGLVEAHGGKIWIEGKSPHGTVVSFTLPMTR